MIRPLILCGVALVCVAQARGGNAQVLLTTAKSLKVQFLFSQKMDADWTLADVYLVNSSTSVIRGMVGSCPLSYTVLAQGNMVHTSDAGSICNTALYAFSIPAHAKIRVLAGVRLAQRKNSGPINYRIRGTYSVQLTPQKVDLIPFKIDVRK